MTHNHTMHCCSQAFTEGYASIPKYTLYSESSWGKFLGLSSYESLSLLNSPHTDLYFSLLFHFSFFFHFMHFSQFLSSFTQPWCKWNVMRLITLIHKYHQYHIKFPTSPYIIEITIILQLHNFPTTPIILIIKYNYFLHTKITKNNPIISNNSNLN